MEKIGGRKFAAFLLLLATMVLFVMTKRITDQTVIRDLLIALGGVYGLGNVAAKFAPGANPGPPGAKTIDSGTRQ